MTPEIISSDGVEVEELKARKNLYYYHLMKGNKHLMLIVHMRSRIAITSLENNPEGTSTAGATTLLYQKALSIMRNLAQESGRSISYRFRTSDQKMQAWLRSPDKGQTVLAGAEIRDAPVGIEAILEIKP